jgi:ribokinase
MSAAPRPIVVVGSLNADLVVRVERFPVAAETVMGHDLAVFPGGKGANQAVAAGRLGGRVHMIGRVGADDHGRLLRASLVAAGVDTAGLRDDSEAPSGTALITTDASGQNQIVVVAGANGHLTPDDVERSAFAFAGAAVVLLQLEVPLPVVEAAARLGRRAGATVVLDPAPARRDALDLLPLVDVVTPNELELRALTPDERPGEPATEAAMARRLLGRGARQVIAKLGARGALVVSADGDEVLSPLAVRALDTTAAGDVFNGAYAVALAEGRSPTEAGAFAIAASALSVTRRGAQPSMPTRAEVEAFRVAERTTSR